MSNNNQIDNLKPTFPIIYPISKVTQKDLNDNVVTEHYGFILPFGWPENMGKKMNTKGFDQEKKVRL